MEAKLVNETLDEGLLGTRKPKRITDGIEMDWIVNLIDMIEDKSNINRDKVISMIEDNIDFFKNLFNRRFNTYDAYNEILKNKLI